MQPPVQGGCLDFNMPNTEQIADALRRAQELSKQLQQRAQLYRLLGQEEIAEEFQRLARVEVQPIAHLLEEPD